MARIKIVAVVGLEPIISKRAKWSLYLSAKKSGSREPSFEFEQDSKACLAHGNKVLYIMNISKSSGSRCLKSDISVQCNVVAYITRSSAIAGRPRDAKACQRLLDWTWKWQPRLEWPSNMYLKVIKSGTNRKLVYDLLLVLCSNFCNIHVMYRLREIWCETV